MSISVLPPNPQPQIAPTPCCKQAKAGECELTTFAASQIGSLLALVILLTVTCYHAVDATSAVSISNTFVRWYLAFLACSITYFFLGCWVFEIDYVDFLRSLTRPINYIEFWLRVGILIYFSCFSSFVAWKSSQLLRRYPGINDPVILAATDFLLYLYFSFILWDVLILLALYLASRSSSSEVQLEVLDSPRDVVRIRRPAIRVILEISMVDLGGMIVASLLYARVKWPTATIVWISDVVVVIGLLAYACLFFKRILPVFVDDPTWSSTLFQSVHGPFGPVRAYLRLIARCIVRTRLK